MAPPPGLGTSFLFYPSLPCIDVYTLCYLQSYVFLRTSSQANSGSKQALHQACPLPLGWHLLQVSSKPILPHKLIDQVDCPPPSSRRPTCQTSTSTHP